MPKHRADCTECPWSYRDEDLVDVSDEMERHARKEHHHVDLQRAVATDGGVDQAETGVTHEHRIEPGDVVYDLGQQGQPKLQVRHVLAESVAEYERREDFDLSTYKHHSRLPVSRSDRVLECVYLPDDPGAAPSDGNPYPVPSGRVARSPVELADEGHRIQDELRLDVLETMFRRAKSIDEDPGDAADTLVETVRLLAGDDCVELLDEAEELTDAARFGGGDGSDD